MLLHLSQCHEINSINCSLSLLNKNEITYKANKLSKSKMEKT